MVNWRQVVFSIFSSSQLFPTKHGQGGYDTLSPWSSNVPQLSTSETTKSIAIVGAGSAGLAMLKALFDLPDEIRQGWDIVLYEQRRNVGGVWLPDPNPVHPPDLPETPLYPLLHTNTPVPTMTYPGFPFPPDTPLYPSHEYIEKYHQDFAIYYNFTPQIRLNHTVLSSSWIGNQTAGRWNVTVRDHRQDISSKFFDHLIVANGHNHYPHIVILAGQDEWLRNSPAGGPQREIMHSLFYREPEKYTNRTVVVVGAGASGRDASIQVVKTARKTYQSVRDTSEPPMDPAIIQKPEISHFTADAIVFVDGTSVRDADAIILGTGYDLRIPFLEEGGELTIEPNAHSNETFTKGLVTNLRYLFPVHQHIFSLAPSYPPTALSFIGLPILVSNCPSDYAQGIYAAHIISNASLLPPKEELLRQLNAHEDDLRARGYDPYNIGHRLINGSTFDYQDDLIESLKQRGALPNYNKNFVEGWRREVSHYDYLKRGWARVELLGTQSQWLEGVRTEEQWADLMKRLNDWQKEWENQNGLVYPISPYW